MHKNKFWMIIRVMLLIFLATGNVHAQQQEKSVKSVMDRVISDLYKTTAQSDLMNLDINKAMSLFSKEDLQVLSTKHWMFDVNVPVCVSVICSTGKNSLPFWVPESGFKKTSLTMKNEQTTYEVWQKNFPEGKIGLGVNGFENGLALHYFVAVGPQKKGSPLKISNLIPDNQHTGILKNGASTYMDWDELVLEDVPEQITGHYLLTTTRGRAAESHLVGAFRSTPYPSSEKPDQVILTWSANPQNSMDIQWRTNTAADASILKFREKGTTKVTEATAEKMLMEDRMLMNDRYTNHYTARLKNLNPGTTYQYQIAGQNEWTDAQFFTTSSNDQAFSYLWFGDTHYSPYYAEILRKGWSAHPDASFFSIVGDLVSDGLNRNQWDALFEYSKETASRIPFMSVPGNHDNRAGLGAKMYCELFSYPMNGPDGVPKEQTYSFTYKNALFLMIDATSPIDAQTAWIENQLAGSKATWKIAMFHFSPYNREEPYLDIQKAWIPLFDKYHVDMVYGGHLHYYMRSKPMKAGKVVSSYMDGTAYVISVGIPNRDHQLPAEPYAEVTNGTGHLYQYVKIDGNSLYFEAVNAQGKMVDTFTLKK
ncbi:MAG TPA: metallophosphoesterase family protein [Prolixibacteraceae bacterium]|nr:metallophosphoesterase family protein [Prolixibacteraceae bacterium]